MELRSRNLSATRAREEGPLAPTARDAPEADVAAGAPGSPATIQFPTVSDVEESDDTIHVGDGLPQSHDESVDDADEKEQATADQAAHRANVLHAQQEFAEQLLTTLRRLGSTDDEEEVWRLRRSGREIMEELMMLDRVPTGGRWDMQETAAAASASATSAAAAAVRGAAAADVLPRAPASEQGPTAAQSAASPAVAFEAAAELDEQAAAAEELRAAPLDARPPEAVPTLEEVRRLMQLQDQVQARLLSMTAAMELGPAGAAHQPSAAHAAEQEQAGADDYFRRRWGVRAAREPTIPVRDVDRGAQVPDGWRGAATDPMPELPPIGHRLAQLREAMPRSRQPPMGHDADAHGRAPPNADAHGRVPPIADAHGRVPPIADAHGRVPPIADAHWRVPPIADAHWRVPPIADMHGRVPLRDAHPPETIAAPRSAGSVASAMTEPQAATAATSLWSNEKLDEFHKKMLMNEIKASRQGSLFDPRSRTVSMQNFLRNFEAEMTSSGAQPSMWPRFLWWRVDHVVRSTLTELMQRGVDWFEMCRVLMAKYDDSLQVNGYRATLRTIRKRDDESVRQLEIRFEDLLRTAQMTGERFQSELTRLALVALPAELRRATALGVQQLHPSMDECTFRDIFRVAAQVEGALMMSDITTSASTTRSKTSSSERQGATPSSHAGRTSSNSDRTFRRSTTSNAGATRAPAQQPFRRRTDASGRDVCNYCGGADHLQRDCPSRSRARTSTFGAAPKHGPAHFSMMSRVPPSGRKADPADARPHGLVTLRHGNHAMEMRMLLDSGASRSLVPEHVATAFGFADLKESLEFKLGDGRLLNTVGPIQVEAEYNGRKRPLEAFVTESDVPPVLGFSDWVTFGIGMIGVGSRQMREDVSAIDRVLSGDDDIQRLLDYDDIQLEEDLSDRPALELPEHIEPDQLEWLKEQIAPGLQANIELDESDSIMPDDPNFEVDIPVRGDVQFFTRQRPIPLQYRAEVTKTVQEWLRKGIIELLRNPNVTFNTSLHAVASKDEHGALKKVRTVLDSRKLNEFVMRTFFDMPRIATIFERTAGFKVASHLDMVHGYHQMRLKESARDLTAFTWEGVRYRFARAPFGLIHLTEYFSAHIEYILRDCAEFVLVYVDDLIVVSRSVEEHAVHLQRVFETLNAAHVRVSVKKCVFGVRKLRLLGFVIDGQSRALDPAKVSDLVHLARPTTGKQVQALLGLAGYLRECIPLYAKIVAPLDELRLVKHIGKRWQERHEVAFRTLKVAVSSPAVIRQPVDGVQYEVLTDASNAALGAALVQTVNDDTHIIALVSRKLTPRQASYGVSKRELLAVVFALQRFRNWILGTHFALKTDHEALVKAWNGGRSASVIHSWFHILLEFDFSIVHCPGMLHVLPDALSRLHLAYDRHLALDGGAGGAAPHTESLPESERDDAAADEHVAVIRQVEQPSNASQEMRKLVRDRLGCRHVDSAEERASLLHDYHERDHQSGERLYRTLFDAGVYWDTMQRDARDEVANCRACQTFNARATGFRPLRSLHADAPWEHVAVDTADVLGIAILLIVDVATRYTVLRMLSDKTGETMASALHAVFHEYGAPIRMQSDNGPEYQNARVAECMSAMQVEHVFVAPVNPQANGLAENAVKRMKAILDKGELGPRSDLTRRIPETMLAMNCAVNGDLRTRPADLFFARNVRYPIAGDEKQAEDAMLQRMEQRADWMQSVVRPTVIAAARERREASNAQTSNRRNATVSESFEPGQEVWLRNDRRGGRNREHWIGPLVVVRVTAAGTYVLKNEMGHILRRRPPHHQLKRGARRHPVVEDNTNDLEGTYTVERILDHRQSGRGYQYLIKWKDYPASASSWEPSSNIIDKGLIRNYWNSLEGTNEETA